jgi:Fe-S oxidoreductase
MGMEDYRSDMETCSRCSACKFIPLEKISGYEHANVCPSIARYNFNAYSGGGRLGFGLGLLNNRLKYDPKVAEIIYNCTLCGACDVSCKYGMDMDVLEPLYAMRRDCVNSGQTHTVLDKLVEKMQKQGPMVAKVTAKGGPWYAGLEVPDYTKQSVSVVFHAGCLARTNGTSGRIARVGLSLLLKAGVEVGIAKDDEACCGGRAYEMGYEEASRSQAALNLARLEESGAAELVTTCAQCYQYFKVLYDKLGSGTGLAVYHITEYLAELLHQGRLRPRKALDLTVTYHDPCHLGRLAEPWINWQGVQREKHMRVYDPPRIFRRGEAGVYEAPREILRSMPGVELIEMDRIREYAWCCGAGGGVPETNPDFAQWTAVERLKEAGSTGAEALVTACPHCLENFNRALSDEKSDLKTYDLVELLDKAI